MKIKKINSMVLVAILGISSISAEPCKNCVATILKAPKHKTSATKFKAIEDKKNNSNEYGDDGLLTLDNNEDDSIVITLDSITDSLSTNSKKLYACGDDISKTLVCDDFTKVCECV